MVTPTKPRVRPAPVPPRGEQIELALMCNSCGRVSTYEISHVLVHPQLERCRAEGWDGVVLGRVIVCRRCGAEDDYQLTAAAHMTLTAQVLTLCATKQDPDESPAFYLGVACLWDGTVVRRPSQGLAVLRDAVARNPGRAELWRRLGNFARRYGRTEEAEGAFRKAVELDEREVEAAHSLAEMFWHADRLPEAVRFLAMTIERLCGGDAPTELRFGMARSALGMVRALLDTDPAPLALMAVWSRGDVGGDPVVSVSSVDLRELSDTESERLAEFLVDKKVLRAGLTSEVPEPGEHTQLAALLSRRDSAGLRPYIPAPAGRNRPCPCGSGKKRKLCCGP